MNGYISTMLNYVCKSTVVHETKKFVLMTSCHFKLKDQACYSNVDLSSRAVESELEGILSAE
jgi:hypothetical protein